MITADLTKKLVELQGVLREIYLLEKENRELPMPAKKRMRLFEPRVRLLEEKEAAIAETKSRLAGLEEDVAHNNDARDKLEDKIKLIKNQKEYEALSTEKEYLLRTDEECVLEINPLREKLANLEQEVAALREENDKEEATIREMESEVAIRIEQNQKTVNGMAKKKEEMSKGIDPFILRQFEKILNHKDGIGIVSVTGDSCNGCHMAVPPQLICELHSGDGMVNCLHCSRILYLEEKA